MTRKVRLSEALGFDFRPPRDQHEQQVQAELGQAYAYAPHFLLAAHLLCAGLLAKSAGVSPVLLGLAGASLLLDLACILFLAQAKQLKVQPAAQHRIVTCYALLTTSLWCTCVVISAGSPFANEARTASLIASLGALVAFMSTPLLVALLSLLWVGALAAAVGTMEGLWAGASFAACIFTLSLYRCRARIAAAHRRLVGEWKAQTARRFVLEFEQSGGGWFWETSADGRLTYLSDQLARSLGRAPADLLGKPIGEILLPDSEDGSGVQERSLGFYLSTKIPFSDIPVRAQTEEEVWWSLSGRPSLDDYGRFLGFRGIGKDLTEQRRSEAEISRLARFDSLTGLANRLQMRRTLDEALRTASLRKTGCALFLLDLDRFKNVNDTLGHQVGDALLRQVAQRLTRAVGDAGQIGRLGGDEFKLVIPGTDDERRLADIAEQLIQQVSMPYMIEGSNISIGVSVGIAVARTGDACADELIRDADLALYAAKAAGKGTYRFFAREMHAEAKDRQTLENDLRGALGRNELEVHYQPVVSSVTEELVGFEALVRWRHPQRGMISPAIFIPLAEECGLMLPLGEWVLRTACMEAAAWPPHVRLAVNISPVQFVQPSLPAIVTSALAASQLAPERLELEITEGVFLTDSPATEEMFCRLKGLGLRLALDDFGTGYSSLGYLKKTPFDKIKIDQSFVRGAATAGSRNAAIVRAIVTLAESLNMDTTAEGAETHDELALIRELGCSQVQGFIFGAAMPAADTATLARASRAVAAEGYHFSRTPRHRLIRSATLHAEGRSISARLRNISSGGALVELDSALPVGMTVSLELSSGEFIDAEVRWSQSGRIGLCFAQPFDLKLLSERRGKGRAAIAA